MDSESDIPRGSRGVGSLRHRHKLPLSQRLSYSVGHVLNDLCASMWFSYLLVYFHFVKNFHSTTAGILLLIGQVADAIATPFVGIESDRDTNWWLCKYGRRKTWHLIGTVCVIISIPFIFNECISCQNSHEFAQVVYYSAFIVIFQFGWASTQISHLSLIPDLTPHSHERVELNAWRYAFTVSANIAVYLITWIVLQMGGGSGSDHITSKDAPHFRNIIISVVAIGSVFSLIFHIGVKEKPNEIQSTPSDDNDIDTLDFSLRCNHIKWKQWFRHGQFYKVGLLYMGTRLCINLTQVYTPLYLQDSLHLYKESIAYIPLVMYCSGFVSSFLMKYLNVHIGKKITYLVGASISLAACTWLYFGTNDSFKKYGIYAVAVMMGISGTTMIITSLSITSDLIGHNTSSGAFVFGAMSFIDKLSNGIAVIIIENLHPCKTCGCSICDDYYRNVLSFVCGGATVMALMALALLAPHKIGVTQNSLFISQDSDSDIRNHRSFAINKDDYETEDFPDSPLLSNTD